MVELSGNEAPFDFPRLFSSPVLQLRLADVALQSRSGKRAHELVAVFEPPCCNQRMKERFASLALLGVLILGVRGATCAPLPPRIATDPARERALHAPVDQLVSEALAHAAPNFVEVERPTFSGMMGPNAPLGGLQFATAGRSAGDPGLCEATVLWVNFGSSGEPLSTQTVYKVVGDLKPLPGMWNDAYGAKLERTCKQAGRVIATESADLGQELYFVAEIADGERVWPAARALQLALEEAKANPASVRCKPSQFPEASVNACTDPIAAINSLALARLLRVTMARCEDDRTQRCVSGEFLRSAEDNVRNTWTLRVRARLQDRSVAAVSGVELEPTGAIYD